MIHFTVPPGDTLSQIAEQYGTTYQAIQAASGISNPNVIYAGQVILIPQGGSFDQWTPPTDSSGSSAGSSSGSASGASSTQQSTGVNTGFAQCVVSHESNGNASAVNASSGAGGLYQFLPSTWASLGFSGSPQDASVATQNAAFEKQFSLTGTAAWAGDGC